MEMPAYKSYGKETAIKNEKVVAELDRMWNLYGKPPVQ